MIQVITINAHLGHRSELVERYREATLVPYGLLLYGLSSRTDYRLPYLQTVDPSHQNFISPIG